MLPNIVDGNDVGVVAEPPHGSGFAGDAGSTCVIQFLGLDEGKGHITVKESVIDEIDLLLAPLTKEFLYLVTATAEGRGLG
jgi:hypothetical protein